MASSLLARCSVASAATVRCLATERANVSLSNDAAAAISFSSTLGPIRESAVYTQRRRAPGRGSHRAVRAMVAAGEVPAVSAKEMERVAAKEALLLAIKDAGGVDALTTGKGNAASKIEVSERILALERLNPTPRPTTSPFLEGFWDFVWAGARNPGIIAARILLTRFPSQVAALDSLQLQIMEGGTRATAALTLLSSIETSIAITCRLAMESPIRLKEEYVEAVVAAPVVPEGRVPAPLKTVFDQLSQALKSLPAAVKEAVAAGLKLPLSGRYERELLISYLDDEMLIARDKAGLVDVLVRSTTDSPASGNETDSFTDDPMDYVS